MTIILGIDPGSRITGFGVIEVLGSNQEYIGSGCIRTDAKASLAHRLKEIYAGVEEIIEQFNPVEFAIEKIFMARSAESSLKLGHARGVAMVAGVNKGLPIYEYEARKVKQAVVGKGSAKKDQVQHMVQTLLKLPAKPQADAADALAIAICHINTTANMVRISGANRFRRGRFVGAD